MMRGCENQTWGNRNSWVNAKKQDLKLHQLSILPCLFFFFQKNKIKCNYLFFNAIFFLFFIFILKMLPFFYFFIWHISTCLIKYWSRFAQDDVRGTTYFCLFCLAYSKTIRYMED
jgi:hypothetical protein